MIFTEQKWPRHVWDYKSNMDCFLVWKPHDWDFLDCDGFQRGTSVSHLYWNVLVKFLVIQLRSGRVDVLCLFKVTQGDNSKSQVEAVGVYQLK